MDTNLVRDYIIKVQGGRCFECAGRLSSENVGSFRIIDHNAQIRTVIICKQCLKDRLTDSQMKKLQNLKNDQIF